MLLCRLGWLAVAVRRSLYALPGIAWLLGWWGFLIVADRCEVILLAATRSNFLVYTSVFPRVLSRFYLIAHEQSLE